MEGLDVGFSYKGMEAMMGVECRDPTGDVRVLDYCLSIPEDQFLRDGQPRRLMRRAMDGILPPEILAEHRRGQQSADWPRFVRQYRTEFLAELNASADVSMVKQLVNVEGLRDLLMEWPATWSEREMQPYAWKLLRGLAVGSFIRRLTEEY
jgi:asparagine synthase (glutamine-hydrolysing)